MAIHTDMTLSELADDICAGDQLAKGVCILLIDQNPKLAMYSFLDLDDLKIRGRKIYDAYKRFDSLSDFCKALKDRDTVALTGETRKRGKGKKPKFIPSTYVREQPIVPRCKECGLRKRRAGHERGEAHILRKQSKAAAR